MLTPYANAKIKQSLLLGVPFVQPNAMFLGLMTDAHRGEEVEYFGYSRGLLQFNDVTNVPSSNSNIIRIPIPPIDYPAETIVEFGLFDKPIGGNCWFHGVLENNGSINGVVLTPSAPIVFGVGSIVINLN